MRATKISLALVAKAYPFVPVLLLLVLTALGALLISRGVHPVAAQSMEQKLWGVYWTTQPGFSSTLEMKNNLVAQPLSVSLSLYFPSGEEYPLGPVQLGPRQTAVIDLNRVVGSLPGAEREGTLEVNFTAPTASSLMGSVSVTNPERGVAWNFFLYGRRPDRTILPLRGLFWFNDSQVDGFVAAQNASEDPMVLTARFEVAGRSYALPEVALAAGQGLKLELRRELRRLGVEDATAGGIEFTWRGAPDALKAHGVLFDDHGFSAEIDFTRFETSSERQTFSLRTPRFAVGEADPALGLPARTTFDPIVALHNFNPHPLNVNLAVGYRQGEVTRQLNIPVALRASDTQVLSFLQYLNGVLPPEVSWASLEVSYSDWHNGLVGAMVSVSEDGEHSIRSVLNWVDGSNREGWYWRADADYNTFIGILNADTENARVAIGLDYYADGARKDYELPQRTLAAHAASVVDIGELISSGQPDVHGQVIPAGVTFGGYHVRKVGPRLQTTLDDGGPGLQPPRARFSDVLQYLLWFSGSGAGQPEFLLWPYRVSWLDVGTITRLLHPAVGGLYVECYPLER